MTSEATWWATDLARSALETEAVEIDAERAQHIAGRLRLFEAIKAAAVEAGAVELTS